MKSNIELLKRLMETGEEFSIFGNTYKFSNEEEAMLSLSPSTKTWNKLKVLDIFSPLLFAEIKIL